jgi:hypothetical protein
MGMYPHRAHHAFTTPAFLCVFALKLFLLAGGRGDDRTESTQRRRGAKAQRNIGMGMYPHRAHHAFTTPAFLCVFALKLFLRAGCRGDDRTESTQRRKGAETQRKNRPSISWYKAGPEQRAPPSSLPFSARRRN